MPGLNPGAEGRGSGEKAQGPKKRVLRKQPAPEILFVIVCFGDLWLQKTRGENSPPVFIPFYYY